MLYRRLCIPMYSKHRESARDDASRTFTRNLVFDFVLRVPRGQKRRNEKHLRGSKVHQENEQSRERYKRGRLQESLQKRCEGEVWHSTEMRAPGVRDRENERMEGIPREVES